MVSLYKPNSFLVTLKVMVRERPLLVIRDGEAILGGVENLEYLGGQGVSGLGTFLNNNLK